MQFQDYIYYLTPAKNLVAVVELTERNRLETTDLKSYKNTSPIGRVKDAHFEQVIDIDGNGYWAIVLKDFAWMLNDLRTTRYQDSSAIPEDYFRVESNDSYTYNWRVIRNQNICPCGWHVPNDGEWLHISYLLKNSIYQNRSITEASLSTKGSFIFSMLANQTQERFIKFWSSSELNERLAFVSVFYPENATGLSTIDNKENRYPIRCIKQI